jgi:ubiquinone/menaquinone biosynthesis C-methylase UbiE
LQESSNLIEIAAQVGKDWVAGQYYDDAELHMEQQWSTVVWPIIKDSDFSTILELAPGHGRNTAKLLDHAQKIFAVDINQTNVDVLSQRFKDNAKVSPIRNTGADLRMIDGASITFVYCFDAMVHFDSDIVRAYIREFRRVMKPGARGFIHYSANDKNPTGDVHEHPGWRNFMSRALFEHWLAKEGFRVLTSAYIVGVVAFTDSPDGADCVSYFELPTGAEPYGSFYDAGEHIKTLSEELQTLSGPVSQSKERKVALENQIATLKDQIAELEARLRESKAGRAALETSTSWRLTAPLRQLMSLVRGR